MDRTEDRFALIGAGPIGLCVARALAQHGIAYTQFDSARAVGGNWRDGVYETAHIISSRKTTEFSDYPMPAGYPDFPSGAQMLAYVQDYARHYDLEKNIVFGTTVTRATPASADGRSRRVRTWSIRTPPFARSAARASAYRCWPRWRRPSCATNRTRPRHRWSRAALRKLRPQKTLGRRYVKSKLGCHVLPSSADV